MLTNPRQGMKFSKENYVDNILKSGLRIKSILDVYKFNLMIWTKQKPN